MATKSSWQQVAGIQKKVSNKQKELHTIQSRWWIRLNANLVYSKMLHFCRWLARFWINVRRLAVCCCCEDNTSKRPVFEMWNMQEFGIQIEWTMTGQSRTTTSRRKELCTWNRVCVVKWSWREKPSCWTVRRPTNDNVKTNIQRNINTKRMKPSNDVTLGEHVNVRVVVGLLSLCSVSAVTLIPCTHRLAQDVRVFVSSHPCMKWASSDFLDLFITFIFPLSFLNNLKQFLLPFNFVEVQ